MIKAGMIGTCSALLLMLAVASFNTDNLRTSDEAVMMIIGFESCRLKPYQCSAGRWTDGIGNTINVEPGKTITEHKAARQLVDHLSKLERRLVKVVTVDTPQHVWDALTSFAYNVGISATSKSTLMKKLNSGDTEGACLEMSEWVYSKGKKLNGLVDRREVEKNLCLGYGYPEWVEELKYQFDLQTGAK